MNKKRVFGHIMFLIVIAIYFTPYFYFGENFTIDAFDNMDSNIVWSKLGLENIHLFFTPMEPIPNILGGVVPFSSLYSNFDIAGIIFLFFGYYWGFVANRILMAVIGYMGIFSLFSSLFKIQNPLIKWMLSVSFAIIPFWGFSLNIMGAPLLIYCLHLIYLKKSQYFHWLFLIIFPLYSHLVLVGIFIIAFSLCLIIFDCGFNKKKNTNFIKAIILITALYALSHFPLIYSFLFGGDYLSHRTEMKIYTFGIKRTLFYIWDILYKGVFVYHGNKPYLNYLYLAPVFLGGIWMLKKKDLPKPALYLWRYFVLALIVIFCCTWTPLASIYSVIFKIIPITWDRILWFIPIFWILMIGVTANYFIKKHKLFLFIFIGIIGFQTKVIINNHKYYVNRGQASYNQFYSTKLFKNVEEVIGKDKTTYRVMNIGIHPAIAQFNGFYTIDGFTANYPLSYKHKYKEMIIEELRKEGFYNSYRFFQEWGSWCYSFAQDCDIVSNKNKWTKINDLNYNWDIAKELGAEYILTPCEINLENFPNLSLLKSYNDKEYYYPLWVYQIN